MPQALTSTSTSVEPGSGTGIDSIDIGAPTACMRAARIMAGTGMFLRLVSNALEVRALDHRRPFGDVGLHPRAEFRRACRVGLVADGAQPLDHARLLENGHDLGVEALDRRRRQPPGPCQAETRYPGTPDSAMVGTSGSAKKR